jgi:uroporphyrinogen-III decarboxylase
MCLVTDEPEMVRALLEKTTRFLTDYVQAFRQAGDHGIVTAVQDDDFLVGSPNCVKVRPLLPAIVATGARAFHFGNAVS